jgi:hypothetical protein
MDNKKEGALMGKPFRNSAAFGKRIEHWVIGRMLKEGLDVYLPLVDDDAIDAVVKRPDGTFVAIQIKARSADVRVGSAGLFGTWHHELRDNYWFVLYSERLDATWLMTSEEFIKKSHQNKSGANIGKRQICLSGKKNGVECCNKRFEKYEAKDFSRLIEGAQ